MEEYVNGDVKKFGAGKEKHARVIAG